MNVRILCFATACLLLVAGCKKDEDITAELPPDITYLSDDQGYQDEDVISGAPGVKMTIQAEFTDAVGIKSFRLVYPEWNLDNTIDLTEIYPGVVITNYTMEYNFKIPENADESKNHEIALIVTNLGDLSAQGSFTVMLNGDFEAPQITNVYPGNNSTVPPF